MDWKTHWQIAPTGCAPTDFFRQVGKTVGGSPITQEQFSRIVQQLTDALAVSVNDNILDLCCGNGLITRNLSERCASICGVDYSQPLIAIAQQHHQRDNICYLCASVLELPEMLQGANGSFSKVYMYEALQHFSETDIDAILAVIERLSTPGARIFFGSVPDRQRIWKFYDTPGRRRDYEMRVAEGREAIGTWWRSEFLEDAARRHGMTCHFMEQHASLHTAHYRFDVLLSR